MSARHCQIVLLADDRQKDLPIIKRSRCVSRKATSTPVLLLIIALTVIATLMCHIAFMKRFDSELRGAVQKQLAEMFPRAKVYVQRASKGSEGAVVAEAVRMATEINGKTYQVFHAEQVIIKGKLDISDFIKQAIEVQQVELIGVQVDAWPLANGSWSIECLKPVENPQKNAPKIVLNDSVIRVRQGPERQAREIVVHGVRATVESIIENNIVAGQTQRKQLRIIGSAQSSGLLEKVNVQCQVDLASKSIVAAGNFTGLQFSPRLLERLPIELSKRLSQFSGLECEASSNLFEVNWTTNQAPLFKCQGQIHSGRLQDPRLPYPIEKISSQFNSRNGLLQLRNMTARSGEAKLRFSTDIMGLSLDSPMVIQAQVEDLELDKRLYQSLPAAVQQQWDKLQLAGRVSGKLDLHFDGIKWRPEARITCQKVSAKPWLFPYEFTQIEGEIQYVDGTLTSNLLRGRASGQAVEAAFSLKHVSPTAQANPRPLVLASTQQASSMLHTEMPSSVPQGTQWLGTLQCRSLGGIPIDEDLITALTPTGKPQSGAERFIRSLNISGNVELMNASFQRDSVDNPKWRRTLEINIYDTRVQYEKFPFPVYNIRGTVHNQGDDWWIDGFEGRNDSARIFCTGSWQQVPQGLLPFRLEFTARTVPAVDDLFYALPDKAKQVWEELQPTGSIDNVLAVIQRPKTDGQIDTEITLLEGHDASLTGSKKSLRLLPRKLPYLLDDVSGKVVYRNGLVTIEQATAQNGATRLSIKGKCHSISEHQWLADITWLSNTRVMVDSQFVRALPDSIQESMRKIDFYGPVSILGRSETIFGKDEKDIQSAWDCQLDIEDGRLASGTHLSAMRGTISVRGNLNSEHVNATGQIAMDAMRVLKTPVTNMTGPFVIIDNKLFFGSAVQEALPSVDLANRPADITASALAGTLKLSGSGRLDSGKFFIESQLENARLNYLLKDIGIQSQQPDATCNATLKFRGVPWNPQTYDGDGEVRLTDAKLYELPFMMRFFSVTSVNANDASAFQSAQCKFRLDGEHIPLDVSADGEVLRLRGEGWTNLRRDINLQLYTYVGRRVPIGTVISPLLPESRFSTFMMVEVTGTLENPDMQRRAFPQLEATLQQMFPEVAERRPVRDTIQRWRN